ncbi:hypothetical protein LPJ71_000931, partial [Coemansia sp. S17]
MLSAKATNNRSMLASGREIIGLFVTSTNILVLDFVDVFDHLVHRPDNRLATESDEEGEEQKASDSSDSQEERCKNEDVKKNDDMLYLEDMQESLQSWFGSLSPYHDPKFLRSKEARNPTYDS